MKRSVLIVGFGLSLALAGGAPLAFGDETASVSVTLKDHRFSPAEPTVAAGKPIVIEVTNLDPTPSEFESKTLRVEKVVPAAGKYRCRCGRCPPAAIGSSTTTMSTRPRVF